MIHRKSMYDIYVCDMACGQGYNTTLSALEDASQWRRVLDLFERTKGPDVLSFSAVLGACQKAA